MRGKRTRARNASRRDRMATWCHDRAYDRARRTRMSQPSPTEHAPPRIRRSLGRFEVTCLGVNSIVGAGIFALPDDLFREMGGLSPLVFVIVALGLMPIAWCYAESARDTERS